MILSWSWPSISCKLTKSSLLFTFFCLKLYTYVIQTRNLKQALNKGVVLKKVHRGNKFNQKAWLETYMIIELRQKAATNFEKGLLKLMNNAVFKKNHVKCKRTQRHYTCHNKKKRNYLVQEPNFKLSDNFFLKIY